jgi:hypothetical protein
MNCRSILPAMLLLSALSVSKGQAQTVTNETPIAFGQMVVGSSGTVTIPSNADTRSATGSIALVGTALVQRGYIDVTYTPGAVVTISVPASLVMTGANAPTLSPTIEGGISQTIPLSGVLRIYFGGTITFSSFGSTGVVSAIIPVTITP